MSELPRGWVEATLDDVFILVRGLTYAKEDVASASSEAVVALLRANNIQRGKIDLDDLIYLPIRLAKDEQIVRFGDILLATSSGSRTVVGKAARITSFEEGLIFGAFCGVVRPRYKNADRFFFHYLKSHAYREYVEAVAIGNNINNFRSSDILRMPIVLPPLAEQKRIVARLDALNAKSARARTELARIDTLVSRYKQAVLSKAFSGELTNREASIVWPTVKLEEIAEVGTGATPKRGNADYYSNGSIPWITSGAVNQGLILQADDFITDRAIQETNCKLFPAGTLVVAMYGEGKTRGKVALLGLSAATNQALAAVRIRNSEVSALQYVYLFLQSVYLALREEAAGGVQPNLNLSIVKAIQLPLPPLEEQHEIVRRIESAFARIDRLAAEAKRALELVGRLDEAILAKAFRGELVPQDENDEPADRLLERIRAEREAAPKPKRGRRKMA
ncbi:restriction endonuclease subunit S [Amorphus orientalis]|uniref:Type I restriction enzyme S subunit n=1 Tax=Amorphus orientalis TaxID=649198 RepID=A0AAE4AT23_9HYPH|nr:restriction endonuclease subunit S [Amorphus orientalis]MDQ0316826.1 type I restriction enzyme S subunit [Amorphus orientalis]